MIANVVLSVGLMVAVAVFAQALRAQAREHARERQLLVNQVLHLAGHTWQPPPIPERPEPEEPPVEYVRPSQLPD